MVKPSNPDLLTAREAARFLRVHYVTLARWRSSGQGPPYVRVQNLIMYKREALEQYLRVQSVSHKE